VTVIYAHNILPMVVIMKNTTRKAPASKNPDRVDRQLATRIAKPDVKAVSKARRVFAKAGCPDPTNAEVKEYLAELVKLSLKSSRPLAKSIRGSK
jgi:hypothetical protein